MFKRSHEWCWHSAALIVCVLVLAPLSVPAATDTEEDRVVSFAECIFHAWQDGKPMPQISVAYPDASRATAYGVQKEFVRRIMDSEKIGGFKAAGVANPASDYPLVAVMLASGIVYATDAIVIDLSQDMNRHVETEIGYVFGKAIIEPVADVTALRQYVKAVTAIVEVPGGAVETKQPGTENDIIAWNINAKVMIVGAEHNPDDINLDSIAITLEHNGETVNTARGDMAAGGQWNTLLKTVNHVLAQGYTIQPGHIITNGALGKILKATQGNYCASFGALEKIEFKVW